MCADQSEIAAIARLPPGGALKTCNVFVFLYVLLGLMASGQAVASGDSTSCGLGARAVADLFLPHRRSLRL